MAKKWTQGSSGYVAETDIHGSGTTEEQIFLQEYTDIRACYAAIANTGTGSQKTRDGYLGFFMPATLSSFPIPLRDLEPL
ncbi:hypothetical protein MNBD_GAMMA11-478 [hydrothermal vent metagenome]|uniref:Uncharacterized protein n=1 Tax=hydrothermal vent metagenome TaxID=652676 RepID=A0A3B0X7H9_9ZZZZ